jgi:hypothetical protein
MWKDGKTRYASMHLQMGIRQKRVLSITSRPLFSLENSIVTHYTVSVDTISGLDTTDKKSLLSSLGIEP